MRILWGVLLCSLGHHSKYYWATSYGDLCARCKRLIRGRWQRIEIRPPEGVDRL